MRSTRQRLLAIWATTVAISLTPLAHADNISCDAVMKKASEWERSNPIHTLTLLKAMSPEVKTEIGNAGRYREVPKGMLKRIEQAQIDFFAKECKENPGLDSYNASKRALEKTRKTAKEYLEYRKK